MLRGWERQCAAIGWLLMHWSQQPEPVNVLKDVRRAPEEYLLKGHRQTGFWWELEFPSQ